MMGSKHKNVLNILGCEINASWNRKIILSLLELLNCYLKRLALEMLAKTWNKFISGWEYNSKSTLKSFAVPMKLNTMYLAILFPVFINDNDMCFTNNWNISVCESLCHSASPLKAHYRHSTGVWFRNQTLFSHEKEWVDNTCKNQTQKPVTTVLYCSGRICNSYTKINTLGYIHYP